MTHWAATYVGEEWVAGTHDCWGFFRRVQRERFCRQVPAVDVDAMSRMACVRAMASHEERNRWEPTDSPQEGDAVLMAHSRFPSHVGVWVNNGVLHCIEHAGVVFQTLASLRLAGWHGISFYRHK